MSTTNSAQSNAADFLVELGTEELPPKALLSLRDALRNGVTAGIDDARLEHGDVLAFATPRRLAVLVQGLQLAQPEQKIENRGPPLTIAYDADGKATKAAEAFAAKCGVPLAALDTRKTAKGEWLYYEGTAAGANAADLLEDIVAKALAGLPIPKRMRWGASDVEFVRPVHWLVMLLGKDVVPAEILGLQAGRVTFGHRFLAPDPIELKEPADYADVLRNAGKVIADFTERLKQVEANAKKAAAELGGDAVLQPEVLEEVTALVEWPVPVAGRFAERFLQLPPEVLIYTLQDHQRYFPVTANDKLLPAFVATSNISSNSPDEVRRGNERVVLPRLADAEFFWDQDKAVKLADRQDDLQRVVYQKGLGSLHDKSARVAAIAAQLAPALQADATATERAARLARTDLLTAMVGEFPVLQGRMGYYYATHDGEPAAVATAIEEQYLPRHAGDHLPATAVGQALSLADRLDTLAGIFALGKRPSGNKDPFGLRRQALGLVRIIIESGIDVNLPELLQAALELQPVDKIDPATAAELYNFIMERMRAWYIAGQAPGLAAGDITPEMFEAVRSRAPVSLLDFHERLRAVQQFMGLAAADSLAAANKRIANILKKNTASDDAVVDTALFDAAAEKQLHTAVNAVVADHEKDLAQHNYQAVLERLARLQQPVDGYFDEVMVMADDERQRTNRLAQLGQLRKLFLDVADISCIPTAR